MSYQTAPAHGRLDTAHIFYTRISRNSGSGVPCMWDQTFSSLYFSISPIMWFHESLPHPLTLVIRARPTEMTGMLQPFLQTECSCLLGSDLFRSGHRLKSRDLPSIPQLKNIPNAAILTPRPPPLPPHPPPPPFLKMLAAAARQETNIASSSILPIPTTDRACWVFCRGVSPFGYIVNLLAGRMCVRQAKHFRAAVGVRVEDLNRGKAPTQGSSAVAL